jgi:hypothetical protein
MTETREPKRRWRGFVAGRSGRLITLILLTAQLGGCAVDLVTEQRVLLSAFCTAAFDDGPLEIVSFAVWLALCLSWFAGLVAIRIPPLRPFYWSLVLLIPFAFAGQAWLLYRHILFCDVP